MTSPGSLDGEIGRGRQRNEDDSSRESSPTRPNAPKRPFSPQSDDGDVVVQEQSKEKTPSPAARPIIRESLGFSNQVSVMTYEAKVVQPKTNHFLPGQEVPLPPKQKATRKNQGKKRRSDAYSGQTSRFRLETYDPTPTTEPPTTQGNGPYTSLYRNVGHAAHRKNVPEESRAGPSGSAPMGGSTSSSNTVSILPNTPNHFLSSGRPTSRANDSSNVVPAIPFQPTNMQKTQQVLAMNDLTSSSNPHPPSQTHPAPSPSSRPLSADGFSQSAFVANTSLTGRDDGSPGPYYRRNYDEQLDSRPRQNISSRNTSGKSSSPDSCPLGHSQVVTLLITDIRSESEEPDLQLAEVRVVLKKADELEEGWWADAKDIAKQLQEGAARIDGPARVYTMRGKYRQFILRVTAENKDKIVSANVPVSAERTLKLTVELLHRPGAPTRPRQSSGREWSRTYDGSSHRSEERMDGDLNRAVPRKRRASPSFDEHDDRSDHHSVSKIHRRDQRYGSPMRRSPSFYGDRPFRASSSNQDILSWRNCPSMDRAHRRRSLSPTYRSRPSASPPILARAPLPTVHVGPGYPRRDEDAESSEVPDEPFIAAVERLLREDLETSDEYFKAIASNKVCDVVKQYEIVSMMFNKWIGKRPPGFSRHIEEIHIVRALEIDDPYEFINNCEETLTLLKLYGRRGRTNKDPRVIEMLDEQSPQSDAAQKILRLLRAVDDAWRNNRSGPLLNGIAIPEPSGTSDRQGSFNSEAGSVHKQKSTMIASDPKPNSYSSTSKAAVPEERRGKSMFMD